MSNFKEHFAKGAAISVAITTGVIFAASQYFFKDIPISLTLAICVILGSLAPDLDTVSVPSLWTARVLVVWSILAILKIQYPNSFDSLKAVPWLFSLQLVFWANLIFISFKASKHRGLSHKYIFPVGLCALGYKFDIPWLYALAVGICVHDAIDKIYPWKVKSWI